MAAGVIATGLSLQDRRLLTAAQVAFPLTAHPFADLGSVADLPEAQVIARLGALREQRLVRRIGPIFEPAAIGLTTELVAVEVALNRVESVGAEIAGWSQVTHCYLRDHRVNLWFAGAASSALWFEQAAGTVLRRPGVHGAWRLPTLRRFKIGVVFDLIGEHTNSETPPRPAFHRCADGEDGIARDVAVVRVLESDLPLVPEPFAVLGGRLATTSAGLLDIIRSWLECGRMRRYGAQLNHRLLGFTANAMTTWAVPDERLAEAGVAMAADPEVTHCYERPAFDDFPYNLYAMIHGRSREHCLAVAERLSQACRLQDPLPLFSTREFRKSTPPYSELMALRSSS
ncbi:MAG: hypothetical protein ABSD48_01010 [Armatimonadota bacterium]